MDNLLRKKMIQREASNWAADTFETWIGNSGEWDLLVDEIARVIDEEPVQSATEAVVTAMNNLRFLRMFRKAS